MKKDFIILIQSQFIRAKQKYLRFHRIRHMIPAVFKMLGGKINKLVYTDVVSYKILESFGLISIDHRIILNCRRSCSWYRSNQFSNIFTLGYDEGNTTFVLTRVRLRIDRNQDYWMIIQMKTIHYWSIFVASHVTMNLILLNITRCWTCWLAIRTKEVKKHTNEM